MPGWTWGAARGAGAHVSMAVPKGTRHRGVHAWMAALPCKAGKRLSRVCPRAASQHSSSLQCAPIMFPAPFPNVIWPGLPGHKAASVPSLLSLAILQSLFPHTEVYFHTQSLSLSLKLPAEALLSFPTGKRPKHHTERFPPWR